jgi:hypothetical protein
MTAIFTKSTFPTMPTLIIVERFMTIVTAVFTVFALAFPTIMTLFIFARTVKSVAIIITTFELARYFMILLYQTTASKWGSQAIALFIRA